MIVNEAEVAPDIFPPLLKLVEPFLHWYDSPVPVEVTEKVAEPPEHTVLFDGEVVILGAVFTVNETLAEVSLGEQVPLTITL